MIATGRRGHVTEQGRDGEELTVEVEGVGIRALRPEEVRPLPPQIVSRVMCLGPFVFIFGFVWLCPVVFGWCVL